jgi:hypothetical protein
VAGKPIGGDQPPQLSLGGGFGHPMALGGGLATPKVQTKKISIFFFFLPLGVVDHPQGPWGGFKPPQTSRSRVAKAIRPTQFFFFFFFLIFFSFKKSINILLYI